MNQKPVVTASLRCAGPIDLALSDDENEDLDNPPTTRQDITVYRTICTNTRQQIAVGFSPKYEPVLRTLLSSNIVTVREGFTIMHSWNLEIRKVHDAERFDALFSVLSSRESTPIPRSRLCEMCAVAATSSQYVSHLLAPGLINYWYGKIHSRHLVRRLSQV